MPDIRFTAYADDCLVYARLELPEGRLTDYLNEREELSLRRAVIQAHDDGHVVELDELKLPVEEIYAVEALGNRGPAENRLRTRRSRTEVFLGPYRVLGQLHAPPGADAVAGLHLRKRMVPLTTATIGFQLGGETRIRDVETLIVNRRLIDSLREPVTESRLPQVMVAFDPRAKDTTGFVYASAVG